MRKSFIVLGCLLLAQISGCIPDPVTMRYTLVVNVKGQGTVDPMGGTFDEGYRLVLKAETNVDGWYFDRWEGDSVGVNPMTLIIMNSNKTVTAIFKSKIQYTLTANIQGQGTIEPASGKTYNVDEEITLQATPADGWIFARWKGDISELNASQPLTMDSDKTVTAIFVETATAYPQVELQTTMGNIVLELNRLKAPDTVDNFIQYVNDGFYDGQDGKGATIFHRVISGFMAQGGGLTSGMVQKTTRDPIINESNNGLSNLRGTIAMARTSDPNSATSQFFINVVDNTFLDYGSSQNPDGYVVFGNVIQGMDVVDAIVAVQTDGNDTPLTPIIINSAKVLP